MILNFKCALPVVNAKKETDIVVSMKIVLLGLGAGKEIVLEKWMGSLTAVIFLMVDIENNRFI